MTSSYRRIDTTDPRRHDRVRPMKLPAAWLDDSIDVYGFILSSVTMISGAAMITRLPSLACIGLLFALANFAHDKPLQSKKESASQGGPVMGMMFALMSICMISVQKLLGSQPLYQQLGKPAQSTSL